MAVELYNDGNHICMAFTTLVSGEAVQSNQFLIVNNGRQALIDPGGYLTYTPLSVAISKRSSLQSLDLILASHQDPDIIASLDRWLLYTNCNVVCSRLWARFLPHLVPGYQNKNLDERIIPVPDRGQDIPLGNCIIKAVPAHFLHSVGNLQFYDPISKILFSGDMGASDVDDASQPVEDFDSHVQHMQGFHQRYMVSNRACRLWANMVRNMDVEMLVPQHGRPFVGRAMIHRFLDWISTLECGVDRLTQADYQLP